MPYISVNDYNRMIEEKKALIAELKEIQEFICYSPDVSTGLKKLAKLIKRLEDEDN